MFSLTLGLLAMKIIKSENAEPVSVPYQMNQTE